VPRKRSGRGTFGTTDVAGLHPAVGVHDAVPYGEPDDEVSDDYGH